MLHKRRKRLLGANMAIQGDVPLGSGLSSSAALEVASAMVFKTLNEFEMDGTGDGAPLPGRGEPVRGRELRHHGPVHLMPGKEGSRALHRLPDARSRVGSAPC